MCDKIALQALKLILIRLAHDPLHFEVISILIDYYLLMFSDYVTIYIPFLPQALNQKTADSL